MIDFEKGLRLYRFYEALALYDLYYTRISDSLVDKRPNRGALAEDLPITWVPLVFHGTSFASLEGILKDGCLRAAPPKAYVSFTELPIGELSRLRGLGRRTSDIAIGFPRSLLETRGLFQPLYLKHAPEEIKAAFRSAPAGYVEIEDDLGALCEVRVPGCVPLSDAVWILSSVRNSSNGILDHPLLQRCKVEYGIALSYWHPDHQQGMIQEPVYRSVNRNAEGRLDSIECRGAHYVPDDARTVQKTVAFSAGSEKTLKFPRLNNLLGWEGPFTKFEMAQFFYEELKEFFPNRLAEVYPRIQM